MQKEKKTKGIILRKTNYGEDDLIYDLLCESGELLTFFARGAKKAKSKFAGIIQIGNFIYITYTSGKNFNYPREISLDLDNIYSFYAKNLELMNYYADLINITRHISKDMESSNLFEILIQSLKTAEYEKEKILDSYNRFILNCLDEYNIDTSEIKSLIENSISDKKFYYHAESNRIFNDDKPKYLDIPYIKYDDVFLKTYLQKMLTENISHGIRLKF